MTGICVPSWKLNILCLIECNNLMREESKLLLEEMIYILPEGSTVTESVSTPARHSPSAAG